MISLLPVAEHSLATYLASLDMECQSPYAGSIALLLQHVQSHSHVAIAYLICDAHARV